MLLLKRMKESETPKKFSVVGWLVNGGVCPFRIMSIGVEACLYDLEVCGGAKGL